jgi:hypothetical protein
MAIEPGKLIGPPEPRYSGYARQVAQKEKREMTTPITSQVK